jgi:hypothetical protein
VDAERPKRRFLELKETFVSYYKPTPGGSAQPRPDGLFDLSMAKKIFREHDTAADDGTATTCLSFSLPLALSLSLSLFSPSLRTIHLVCVVL